MKKQIIIVHLINICFISMLFELFFGYFSRVPVTFNGITYLIGFGVSNVLVVLFTSLLISFLVLIFLKKFPNTLFISLNYTLLIIFLLFKMHYNNSETLKNYSSNNLKLLTNAISNDFAEDQELYRPEHLNSDSNDYNNSLTTWVTYRSENYQINHPKDWHVDISGLFGEEFFISAPVLDSDMIFTPNISLMIQDLSLFNNISLDSYVEMNIFDLKTVLEDFNLIHNQRHKRDDHGEHHVLIYSGDVGSSGNHHYFLRCQITSEAAYVLTFTCHPSQYEEYKNIVSHIFLSFELI